MEGTLVVLCPMGSGTLQVSLLLAHNNSEIGRRLSHGLPLLLKRILAKLQRTFLRSLRSYLIFTLFTVCLCMKIIKLYTFKKKKITAVLVRFTDVQNSATLPLRYEKEDKIYNSFYIFISLLNFSKTSRGSWKEEQRNI